MGLQDFDTDVKALEHGGPTRWLAIPSAYTRFYVQDALVGFLDDEKEQLEALAIMVIALGFVVILISAMGYKAPYGRHNIGSHWIWGLKMNGRFAWILQESPALILPISNIFVGDEKIMNRSVNQLLLGFYIVHYVNRTLIYPFAVMKGSKPSTVFVCALAFLYNIINGQIQSRIVFRGLTLGRGAAAAGVACFFTGMMINMQSDAILANLRKQGDAGYAIPTGGLFRLVSCANFLGEMLEWFGFAMAAQFTLPALSFFLFTVANLSPRAYYHHQWYKEHFGDKYPRGRRAVFPFLF